jgi:hypothetical protein
MLLVWSSNLDAVSKSTFVGALIGSFVLLFGTIIQQGHIDRLSENKNKQLIKNIKTMLLVDIVNVALGYISTYKIIDAAINTQKNQGTVPSSSWLKSYVPRKMSFVNALGTDLAMLDNETLTAVCNLISNFNVTNKDIIFHSELNALTSRHLDVLRNDLKQDFVKIIIAIKLLDAGYKVGSVLAIDMFSEYIN